MAVSYIQGVQSQNVIATVKHFACNDQEWQRNRADSVVDERTLREIHLPAFEAAVTEGKVRAVMSAYNLVNGQHCSENKHLLTDILKGDWGFQGIVMSDWVSVYSAVAAANNGLDLEMPRPVWFGERLLAAVQSGQVSEQTIDDKIRRLLRVRFESGLFENPSPKPDESVVRSAAHRALALEMAQKSIVLLKNDGLLPLSKDKLKTIAFIGPAANIARTGGGGSSTIQPWEKVSPVAGMKNLLGDRAKVLFAAGVNMDPVKAITLTPEFLLAPDGTNHGLLGEYFDNPDLKGEPLFARVDPKIDFEWNTNSPDPQLKLTDYSIRWTGKLVPPRTQTYFLSLTSDDGSRLYLDGKKVVDNWGNTACRRNPALWISKPARPTTFASSITRAAAMPACASAGAIPRITRPIPPSPRPWRRRAARMRWCSAWGTLRTPKAKATTWRISKCPGDRTNWSGPSSRRIPTPSSSSGAACRC
jgi:beta-glucosidase